MSQNKVLNQSTKVDKGTRQVLVLDESKLTYQVECEYLYWTNTSIR